jgi:ABC-type phosphate transport system substrate-binding protein
MSAQEPGETRPSDGPLLGLTRSIAWRNHRIRWVSLAFTLSLGFSSVNAEVVAVVSADSPIVTLSKTQVIGIFLGRTTRFPDGSTAVPIDQTDGSAARDEFYIRFASMSAAQVKAFWSRVIFTGKGQPPRIAGTALELKQLLIASPNAIGYMDQSLLDSSLKVVLTP